MAQTTQPIAILGAGSWGTALGLYLSRRDQPVHIWSIEKSEISAMLADGANERYLPGHPLPDTLKPMVHLKEAVHGVEEILLAVPSVGLKHTLSLVQPFISKKTAFICATKGLDADTGKFSHQIVEEVLGPAYPFAVLSGPSFAKEVAAGLPTAVMIASKQNSLTKQVIQRFHSHIFHAYPSDDVVGVELGGVAKNVIAIATGISDGLQLGTNARSALITCGLAEITRLGIALGAKAETFTSLAGIGDLMLTASDDQSRNRRFGLALGQGKPLSVAEMEIGQVIEGKRNAELINILAARHHVTIPICQLVEQVLKGEITTHQAVEKMCNR